jgi:hypothetical protein
MEGKLGAKHADTDRQTEAGVLNGRASAGWMAVPFIHGGERARALMDVVLRVSFLLPSLPTTSATYQCYRNSACSEKSSTIPSRFNFF